MHEVGANEAGKFEWAAHAVLKSCGHTQDQESDEGNRDLNPNSILRHADEVLNLQCLLDPAKEQLDLPTLLVEVRDL